jgi:hypothetical protein
MKLLYLSIILGLISSTGCRKSSRDGMASRPTTSAMDTGGMQGMSGIGMGGSAMMAGMRAHMDSVAGMAPGQMSDMLPGHERMMSQMMDQMGSEMRQMNMSPSAAWTALTDSVKADLADLPNLSGQQLATRMKAHAARVRRLIDMHQGMMK